MWSSSILFFLHLLKFCMRYTYTKCCMGYTYTREEFIIHLRFRLNGPPVFSFARSGCLPLGVLLHPHFPPPSRAGKSSRKPDPSHLPSLCLRSCSVPWACHCGKKHFNSFPLFNISLFLLPKCAGGRGAWRARPRSPQLLALAASPLHLPACPAAPELSWQAPTAASHTFIPAHGIGFSGAAAQQWHVVKAPVCDADVQPAWWVIAGTLLQAVPSAWCVPTFPLPHFFL